MKQMLQLTCPYCGHVNPFIATEATSKLSEYYCDSEEGGCHQRFMVELSFQWIATVYSMKKES